MKIEQNFMTLSVWLSLLQSKMINFVMLSTKKNTNTEHIQTGNTFQVLRGVQWFVDTEDLEREL